METAFASVERFEERGTVAVPEPAPLMDRLVSMRSYLDCDAAFERVPAAAQSELAAQFAEHDVFAFAKAVVRYRCR